MCTISYIGLNLSAYPWTASLKMNSLTIILGETVSPRNSGERSSQTTRATGSINRVRTRIRSQHGPATWLSPNTFNEMKESSKLPSPSRSHRAFTFHRPAMGARSKLRRCRKTMKACQIHRKSESKIRSFPTKQTLCVLIKLHMSKYDSQRSWMQGQLNRKRKAKITLADMKIARRGKD